MDGSIPPSPPSPSLNSYGLETPVSGAQTPAPLLKKGDQINDSFPLPADYSETGHSHDIGLTPLHQRFSTITPPPLPTIDQEEAGTPPAITETQGRPPELKSLTAEIIFVVVCSAGLLLFSFLLGDVTVIQIRFKDALDLKTTELPWLVGAFTTANGVSVVVSGSLSDLVPPRALMAGAFAWMAIWNIVGVFSVTPSRAVLFFIVRAMQGISIGILLSGCMSILGRVYKPGIRKNRVFSAMSATAPFGFFIGCLQGGALQAHLPWIFGSNAILAAILAVTSLLVIPNLRPVADINGGDAPTIRDFDLLGALTAICGCVCLLFGLTQGSVTSWAPYNYALIVIGLLSFVVLFFVERRVPRPLIPNRLWATKGFTPLMVAYFLGYGGFAGAWQFYAVQFWLRIQNAAPITAALYLVPNALFGVLAAFIVSRTIHIVPGHYIYAISMFAYTMGPTFFLPQTPNTTYWALSMPGIALSTFGPDLAFAAASIFITSNVARSYQGTAGSLLVTNQNLSTAVMTSVADAIGSRITTSPDGYIDLKGLQAIWWFALGVELLAALITMIWVRIPKEEEKEHVT